MTPAIQQQILNRFDVLLLQLDVNELNRKIRALESATALPLRRTGFRTRRSTRKIRRSAI